MKSNKKVRICSVFFSLIMVFSMIMPMSVFAENWSVTLPGSITQTNVTTVFGETNSKNYGENVRPSSDDPSDGNISNSLYIKVDGVVKTLMTAPAGSNACINIDRTVWNEADNKEKTKVMKTFVDKMSAQNFDENAVHELMTDLQEVDDSVGAIMLPLIFEGTRADIYGAYKAVKPFLDIFSWVLGIGAVALIIILLGSTVLDLAYIGLPVWREAQAGKEGGNGKHPFGVSYEALRTVNEIEQGFGGSGGGEYKNGYLLYLKRRALTYIILAVCIMYLICGGLSGVIAWVLSLTTGLVG